MKLNLVFCTNYNGVNLDYAGESVGTDANTFDALYDKIQEAIEDFPQFTYDMVDKFNHDLTDEQEEHLVALAKERVRPILGEVEIEFEYDDSST